ncbi:phytanoyl-CoA dioxygenase family protein [Granulosicoccus antarcticus]|uniref:Kanamycin B dioxygenase n=1 Tax=Granulosicoccus antarcticus IMCC3135 TaxID=1192854 RepID=A0A2Z2NSY1_9GAMM|nr:phytanoyl-CoA dioxygenase family protein [Granulosicoccus antarcticus]ASJ73131.1 Kanamycin B dioxygenase [Granulosicoccus antarcticus IMCC3135]
MNTQIDTTSDVQSNEKTAADAALEWAGQYVDVSKHSIVSDSPWATTFRIHGQKSDTWLKVLPTCLAHSPELLVLLGQRFEQSVPRVIASDTDRGLLLMHSCDGRDLRKDATEQERIRMLQTYARIQAASCADEELLQAAPFLPIDSMTDALLEFLAPSVSRTETSGHTVNADFYLSASVCATYHELLEKRAPQLQSWISQAHGLTPTLNHGDLRTANASKSGKGDISLYDWDEAVVAPAGISLHALFSGCSTLVQLQLPEINLIDAESLRQPRREFSAYCEALESAGYAQASDLGKGLASAAVAGMIHYIISFGRFPKESKSYIETVEKNLTRRLSDLLDVADLLCVATPTDIVALADDYEAHKRGWRAERLLVQHLYLQADDVPALQALAQLQLRRNRPSHAIKSFEACTNIDINDAMAHQGLGTLHAQLGCYKLALRHLHRAQSHTPSSALEQQIKRVYDLERMLREADMEGKVPTVWFSDAERESRTIAPETLALCATLFRKYGVLILKSVFEPSLLSQCHQVFSERYQAYLTDQRHKDALRIGDKRFQITIDITKPFNDPALYGNGLTLPLMKDILGEACILGCFTSAMSLPGSKDQRLHKDHKALFHDDPQSVSEPSFAVTMMVPLVDLNERVGTTRVKKGSHTRTSDRSKGMPWQTPFVSVGDCYLMDYRLSHHGQANQSDKPRPILSLVYQRPWFRDYINFHNQPSLRLSSDEYEQVPAALKSLLSWTNEPGSRD